MALLQRKPLLVDNWGGEVHAEANVQLMDAWCTSRGLRMAWGAEGPIGEASLTSAVPGAPVLPGAVPGGWARPGLPLVSRTLALPYGAGTRPTVPPGSESAAVEGNPAKGPPPASSNNEHLWNLQAISSLLSFWRC